MFSPTQKHLERQTGVSLRLDDTVKPQLGHLAMQGQWRTQSQTDRDSASQHGEPCLLLSGTRRRQGRLAMHVVREPGLVVQLAGAAAPCAAGAAAAAHAPAA